MPNRVRVSRMIKAWTTRHWVASAAHQPGCAYAPPDRPGRALAEHDIIAVEGFQPAIEHLKHRLGVFFVVGGRADQFAADR